MSRWSDEFNNHPIHQLIAEVTQYLETEAEDADAKLEDERRRLKKVFGNLQEIVVALDSEFYPKNVLDQVNSHFNQHVLVQLRAFAANPDIAQLQAANDQVTPLAPQIYQLAAISRPMESQRVISKAEQSFDSFTAKMEKTANEADERFSKHEVDLAAVNEKAVALEQRLGGLETTANEKLAEWQDDFTERQTTQAQEHSNTQIERGKKFEELLSEWKDKVEEQRTDITKIQTGKLEATLDHFKTTGEDVLKDVRHKHEEVREIHKLVGRDSVAGGYQTSAGEEKTQANIWRIVSLLCLLATVIWLGFKYHYGFAPPEGGGINWPDVITASSLTAILIYAAGYTSRQSKMHRENEKQLRSYALETKALDPFIASLEKADQQAIKAELVRRMFGQQNSQPSGKSTNLDDSSVKTLVDTVAGAANKLINKG